jgi:hypothetical protein
VEWFKVKALSSNPSTTKQTNKKTNSGSEGHQQLTPIILATQEVEIRKITV